MDGVVRVGVAPWKHMNPYCFLNQSRSCHAGVELEILRTVATIINVTLSIVIVNDTGCGKLPAESSAGNGTGTGLMRMLRERKIDIIGNFCMGRKLAFYYDRDVFGLSPSVWQYHQVFVIQTPNDDPLCFRPFAPFTVAVWLACVGVSICYLLSITVDHYVRIGSGNFLAHALASQSSLRRAYFGYSKRLPPRLIWPFWLFFLAFIFMFYKTFILSEVFSPHPVPRPFSDSRELALALRSGEYRLISYKQKPAVPVACLGKECEHIFTEAIRKHGFTYVPNGSGEELLSLIADQDPKSKSKYVLIQGEPFIQLYFRDFKYGRKRLWIVGGEGMETWSSYAWRKDFRYAEQFTRNILAIGDFPNHELLRYTQFRGSMPHTGDKVWKVMSKNAIDFSRIKALSYLHFGGMLTATLMLLLEFIYAIARERCLIKMKT